MSAKLAATGSLC